MITLEQLQYRREARNPAQWDWRLLDPECHAAGNSPILNLKFGRVIKPARSNRGVRHMLIKSKTRQLRAVGRKKHVTRTKLHNIRGMR